MPIEGTSMINNYDQMVIYNKDLDTHVVYCSADIAEAKAFADEFSSMPKDRYTATVLENFISNWQNIVSVLKKIDASKAHAAIDQLYVGCVMLNPALDNDLWDKTQKSSQNKVATKTKSKKGGSNDSFLTPAKFQALPEHLKERVIGQDEVIDSLHHSLKRAAAGLNDSGRPIGVYMFAGTSGSGKTLLANTLHEHVFGDTSSMIRIDCGEYQHRHENQKLLGSPPGYVGHEEGGYLANQLEENPNSVLLFDEVEKAHPDLWHTLLRVFDEGVLTDSAGKQYSLQNNIIILTTNLGMDKTMDSVTGSNFGFGAEGSQIKDGVKPPRAVLERNVDEAVKDHFTPEFLNRIDQILIFNPLTEEDIRKIAELELSHVDSKLSQKGMSLIYTPDIADSLAAKGAHVAEGARRIARERRDAIEGVISDAILKEHDITKGSVVYLNCSDDRYQVIIQPSQQEDKG